MAQYRFRGGQDPQAVRDDLTRENIMRQASNLDMELPLLLQGIRPEDQPDRSRPIKQMRW